MTAANISWDAAEAGADVQGHVAQLWVYPVKSCAGVRVAAVRLDATGLAQDREWMVVDPQGVFLTQRSHPRMALIQPVLLQDGAQLALEVPGPDGDAHGDGHGDVLRHVVQPPQDTALLQVEVWNDRVAGHDQGDAVARWLSAFLGSDCRLVRFDRSRQRPCSRKWTGEVQASTFFADGYPLLITTEAAGTELNARVQAAGGPEVELLRFRANLVLGGLEAHEEDHLDALHIHTAGGVVALRPVKPCTRCPIPDIDPATAESSPEVSTALAAYRADARMGGAITFGMNAIVLQGAGAVLEVGQPMVGTLAFD